MKRLRSSLSVLGVATLCGLAAPGCEENASMLFIKGVLAIETTNCVAKPEAGAVVKSHGVLDVALGNGYSAAFLVGSQLTQRGSREQLRTESARLTLEGAEVTLNNAEGQPLPLRINPFTTLGSGFVDPAGGTQPGFAAIFVDVIPASIQDEVAAAVRASRGSVEAKVRVFGTTLGGQQVESRDFPFSITVCDGCLVQYPESAGNAGPGPFVCGGMSQTGSDDVVCIYGQDTPVPCTTCASTLEVCMNACSNCSVRSNPLNAARCMGTDNPLSCPEPPQP